MLATSPGVRGTFGSETPQTFDAIKGMIAISPASLESTLEWSATRENIAVSIDVQNMEDLAGQELDSVDVELRPTQQVIDPTALEMAKLIKAELNRPNLSTELYLESLITALGIHVLRNYSNAAKPWRPAKGRLSRSAAKRVEEYLTEHLTQKITIAELAAVCGLSPSHFSMSFARTFGAAPHRYLRERRLDLAQRLLADRSLSISEVAFLSGFSSQSHLTSAMRKYRNVTPSRLR